MDIRPLPPEDAAVRRYVEELWLPYHRELEATVDRHRLADEQDVDLVEEEVDFRRGRLESADYEGWIAVDESGDEGPPDDPLGPGDPAGFVTAELDQAPSVFERPDRLLVCDVFVTEPYRNSGLATDLMAHVADRARALGCAELTLEVDIDNDRASAFYDKLGFEPYRRSMAVDVDEL